MVLNISQLATIPSGPHPVSTFCFVNMHPLHDSPPNSPTVRPVGDNPNYEPPRVANPPRKLTIPKYRRSSFFRKRPKTLRRSTMPSPGQASDHSAESDWDDESPSHSQSRLMNSPVTPVTSHPLPFSATTMVNIPFTKVNIFIIT